MSAMRITPPKLSPGAKLAVFDDHGHFSIVTEVVPAISNLLQR
jgi:hypothetical protein